MRTSPIIIGLLCLTANLTVILANRNPTTAKPFLTPAQGATLNLSDFGGVGDGSSDAGPAFQKALDALAASGGGTLFVPAGRYLVTSPVIKNFSTISAGKIRIQGVPSTTMPAPPTAPGNELSVGLNLTSEIIIATGPSQIAFTFTSLDELSFEHIGFICRHQTRTDALISD